MGAKQKKIQINRHDHISSAKTFFYKSMKIYITMYTSHLDIPFLYNMDPIS